MTRSLTLTMVCALLIWGALIAQEKSPPKEKPTNTTVEQILKSPDSFHKKLVQVEGKVEDLQKKVSRAGNKYTTFKLGKTRKLTVYTFGHPDLDEDDEVIVIGRFYKEKKVGNHTFKNEIDASPREGGKITKKENE